MTFPLPPSTCEARYSSPQRRGFPLAEIGRMDCGIQELASSSSPSHGSKLMNSASASSAPAPASSPSPLLLLVSVLLQPPMLLALLVFRPVPSTYIGGAGWGGVGNHNFHFCVQID